MEVDNNTYEKAPGMEPAPTVTLHIPPDRLPAMVTRLTTYLLERQYGFLQTYHMPEHAEFEVFDARDQPVVNLTLQGVSETVAQSTVQTLPDSHHLAPEADCLVQHLLQLEP